ncbi:MAG TPA: pseudouridine synthase [Holophagaceae bacterium]|nr:pseudouridine synthase [Holophagaceae bacterium]
MAKLDQAWTVEAHHAGSALAAELHRHMGVSHRQAKGLIDARCVQVNGQMSTKHGQRLEAGDKLAVAYDPALKYDPIPAPKGASDGAFKTLWEDTHLLFVDKPAGLLTVPAEKSGEPSLADAVADHYRRRGQKHAQLYIVHRLDRFTSGVLVFARTSESLHHLKKLFALHKLQRTYRAILVGELPENQGTLKGHLIEQAKTLKMRVVDPKRKDAEGAQSAVTHYRVVERLPGHTVVEVELETGRRNQIRVQFADRGFPLLGDQVYGEESPLIDRQALHAEVLGLRHPVTDEMVVVKAAPPADFESALKAIRARTRLVRAVAGERGETEAPKVAKKPFERKPGGAKPRRDERPSAGKKPFRPRPEGGEDRPRKPFADRGDKPRFDKPAPRGPRREEGTERPKRLGAREEGEAPRKRFEKKAGAPAGRPRSKPFESREGGEAPRKRFGRNEGASARPRAPRRDESPEGAGRPRPKRFEDREDRPRRAEGGKPQRPRPEGPRDERPRGAGKPGSEGRPKREDGRPPRRFDKAPRDGAPSRPRAASGGGTGKPRPGGARKPFPKKRG